MKLISFYHKRAKIATPEGFENENLSFNESLNLFNKTPQKIMKKISCFEEEVAKNTILEIFPSIKNTFQTDLLLNQSEIKKEEKNRDCGCLNFASFLKIC